MREIRDRRIGPDDHAQWARALERARIPERYQRASPELVRCNQEWLHTALDDLTWMAKGLGFYINGPWNTGKSSLAAVFAMEGLRRCERVLWLSVRDVPHIRFRENDEAARVDDYLRTADLLILDDIGAETYRLDGPAGTALEGTVRILYDRGRSVVFTSNIHWNEFHIRYGINPSFVSVTKRLIVPIVLTDTWPEAPGA